MRLTRVVGSMLMLLAMAPAVAADLPQPAVVAADPVAATEDYLNRRAVLLMIRASFDVIEPEEIGSILAGDLKRIGASWPGDYDLQRLDRDLGAEASYYLVSLRYLIESGGAAWPADRPEQFYADDALVALDALQDELDATLAARLDPLPILKRAQQILLQTEGHAEVPPELDRFAGRDELVKKLVAEKGPRTSI